MIEIITDRITILEEMIKKEEELHGMSEIGKIEARREEVVFLKSLGIKILEIK